MIPDLPDLHDASLESFELGPRRELTLVLAQGEAVRSIRFGAIQNFEAVSAFFKDLKVPAPGAYYDRIEYLRYSDQEPSTAKLLHVDLGLDLAGPIAIACGKLTAGGAPAA